MLGRRLTSLAPRAVALSSRAFSAAASDSRLLVINAGSSTVKYKLFSIDPAAKTGVGAAVFTGLVELSPGPGKDGRIVHQTHADGKKQEIKMPLKTHNDALSEAVDRFFGAEVKSIKAIGHRVAHGGEDFQDASLLTPKAMEAIKNCVSLAPLHNPANLLGIDVATSVFGKSLPQVGVFDTAYHQTMPPKAFTYAIPYELYKQHGIRRYGFHGTSHKFVAEKAAKRLGKTLEESSFVTCHLGNGSSMTAIHKGKSIDTTMGVTPLEGLVMGTRSGDVDPALHQFLATSQGMTLAEVDKMLNKKSGVLGICGDADIRHIQDRIRKNNDPQANLALDVFCHRVRKYLGAYILELGGDLDGIIFTAGIGENSFMMRERVLKNLDFLGIKMDPKKNPLATLGEGPVEIQTADSKVKIFVIPTDEERSIAEQTYALALKK